MLISFTEIDGAKHSQKAENWSFVSYSEKGLSNVSVSVKLGIQLETQSLKWKSTYFGGSD